MRIISGSCKGKKIFLPKDSITRPLRDYVKESIFNILEHSNLIDFRIKGSKILDLFSGVGSFGLECVSRGAQEVTFFENHPEALKILKKNIKHLNFMRRIKIIENDIFKFNNFNKIKIYNFEIVFLDPPFKTTNIEKIIEIIHEKKILKRNGIIIMHRERKTIDNIKNKFDVFIKKNYGVSKIIFGKLY